MTPHVNNAIFRVCRAVIKIKSKLSAEGADLKLTIQLNVQVVENLSSIDGNSGRNSVAEEAEGHLALHRMYEHTMRSDLLRETTSMSHRLVAVI